MAPHCLPLPRDAPPPPALFHPCSPAQITSALFINCLRPISYSFHASAVSSCSILLFMSYSFSQCLVLSHYASFLPTFPLLGPAPIIYDEYYVYTLWALIQYFVSPRRSPSLATKAHRQTDQEHAIFGRICPFGKRKNIYMWVNRKKAMIWEKLWRSIHKFK